MNNEKSAGFVVAVSGGVDSIVLLDILARYGDAHLIVAHYDHGIRPDSGTDRKFVQRQAAVYGLQFVFDEGRLGPGASELTARYARYAFLRHVKNAAGASAIITAHHDDDVLETAVINLIRGTGRKGLSSLKSTKEIYRPLITTPKSNILAYAKLNKLDWREDETNKDTKYLRNYVRQNILPRFDAPARRQLRALINSASLTNTELDILLARQLANQLAPDELNRAWFISLPYNVSREIIAAWLRSAGISQFDRKTIERIVASAKTYAPGKQIDVDGRYLISVKSDVLALKRRER
jgi:tRNA(Ile)-lysidine synthase